MTSESAMSSPRRRVIRVGDEVAVVLTPDQARVLGAKPDGEVEARIAAGTVELKPVDKYAEMDHDEIWAVINENRTRW